MVMLILICAQILRFYLYIHITGVSVEAGDWRFSTTIEPQIT